MSVGYNPKIVTDGLVLCLDAANSKSYPGSGNTWYDLSSNKNVGTLTNGPLFSTANKGKFTFDGINDHYLLSNNAVADNLSNMSLSAWVYANWTNVNSMSPIITKITDASAGQGWEFGTKWYTSGSPTIYIALQLSGGGTYNARYANVPAGTYWANIGVTYANIASSTITLYLNGTALPASSEIVGNIGSMSTITTTASVAIATRNGTTNFGTPYAAIDLANCLIYNRTLSSNEMLINYNALKGRFGL